MIAAMVILLFELTFSFRISLLSYTSGHALIN